MFSNDFCPDLNIDLSFIPALIVVEDNVIFNKGVPYEEEIWLTMKSMNADFVADPEVWDIIKGDLVSVVVDLFLRNPYPKFFSYTSIALLPKNDVINFWNDFLPISFYSFFNKIKCQIAFG